MRSLWIGLCALGVLGVLGWAGHAGAEEGPDEAKPPRVWTLRAGFGFGLPVQSNQEALVSAEYFGGPRFHATAELARMFSERFGVGLRGMYGWRSAGASVGESGAQALTKAPSYGEQFAGAAVEVPVVFDVGEGGQATLSLVPFVGPGWGSVGIYRGGPWQVGPLFGGEVELYVPRGHIGVSVGASFLPLPPPGQVGAHNDLGSYFVSLILGADVG